METPTPPPEMPPMQAPIPPPSYDRCPHCSAPVNPEQKMCPNCGAPLRETSSGWKVVKILLALGALMLAALFGAAGACFLFFGVGSFGDSTGMGLAAIGAVGLAIAGGLIFGAIKLLK